MRVAACAAAALLCASACGTAPVMRPVGPPLLGTSVEAGVAPYGMVSQTAAGAGAMSWAAVQVVPDVDVLARGYGADFFLLDGSTPQFSDVMVGGEVGIRTRKEFLPHMLIGAEATVGIEQRSGPLSERVLSVSVGVPVAEQAFENVWVFTDLSLGLALPLTPDPSGRPFYGFNEIPIGIAWQVQPWLLVLAEGGYALPITGGYGSLGVAFRL